MASYVHALGVMATRTTPEVTDVVALDKPAGRYVFSVWTPIIAAMLSAILTIVVMQQ